jgi:hypothetical protein
MVNVKRTAALSAMALVVLGASPALAATDPNPPASHCASSDSTWYAAVGASQGSKATQTHEFSTKVCETRTSSTKMTISWNWAIHGSFTVSNASVAFYMYNCSTQAGVNPAYGGVDIPKPISALSGSGSHVFTVSSSVTYRVGLSGSGATKPDPGDTTGNGHFSAEPPSNITPFTDLSTSCL